MEKIFENEIKKNNKKYDEKMKQLQNLLDSYDESCKAMNEKINEALKKRQKIYHFVYVQGKLITLDEFISKLDIWIKEDPERVGVGHPYIISIIGIHSADAKAKAEYFLNCKDPEEFIRLYEGNITTGPF